MKKDFEIVLNHNKSNTTPFTLTVLNDCEINDEIIRGSVNSGLTYKILNVVTPFGVVPLFAGKTYKLTSGTVAYGTIGDDKLPNNILDLLESPVRDLHCSVHCKGRPDRLLGYDVLGIMCSVPEFLWKDSLESLIQFTNGDKCVMNDNDVEENLMIMSLFCNNEFIKVEESEKHVCKC